MKNKIIIALYLIIVTLTTFQSTTCAEQKEYSLQQQKEAMVELTGIMQLVANFTQYGGLNDTMFEQMLDQYKERTGYQEPKKTKKKKKPAIDIPAMPAAAGAAGSKTPTPDGKKTPTKKKSTYDVAILNIVEKLFNEDAQARQMIADRNFTIGNAAAQHAKITKCDCSKKKCSNRYIQVANIDTDNFFYELERDQFAQRPIDIYIFDNTDTPALRGKPVSDIRETVDRWFQHCRAQGKLITDIAQLKVPLTTEEEKAIAEQLANQCLDFNDAYFEESMTVHDDTVGIKLPSLLQYFDAITSDCVGIKVTSLDQCLTHMLLARKYTGAFLGRIKERAQDIIVYRLQLEKAQGTTKAAATEALEISSEEEEAGEEDAESTETVAADENNHDVNTLQVDQQISLEERIALLLKSFNEEAKEQVSNNVPRAKMGYWYDKNNNQWVPAAYGSADEFLTSKLASEGIVGDLRAIKESIFLCLQEHSRE